jgi:hypothetical protein
MFLCPVNEVYSTYLFMGLCIPSDSENSFIYRIMMQHFFIMPSSRQNCGGIVSAVENK